MTSGASASRPLTVEGAVDLEHDLAQVSVRASGETVVARTRDARSVRALISAGPGNVWRRDNARRLHSALDLCGLTLDLRLGRRHLARLGSRARPTFAARLAGVPGVQLGWLALGLYLQSLTTEWVRRNARR